MTIATRRMTIATRWVIISTRRMTIAIRRMIFAILWMTIAIRRMTGENMGDGDQKNAYIVICEVCKRRERCGCVCLPF